MCKAEIETQIQRTDVWTPKGEKGVWNGWVDGDWHIYTVDTMYKIDRAPLVAQAVKNLPAMQKTWVP